MNAKIAATTGLRLISGILRLQGMTDQADTINQLLALSAAGKNVDKYMGEIAVQLDEKGLEDWSDIKLRIDSEVNAFLAPDPDPEAEDPEEPA